MAWLSRWRGFLRREKLAREHEEELRFHLSMREQLNVQQGMAPGEARRNARLRFGNPSVWRERMREIDLTMLPGTVLQDLRYGARMLWRNVGFTLAAVLALGIGIGVNTATFTAYKAFFKRSLDARDSGQMVNLALLLHAGSSEQSSDPVAWFSIPDYEAYRDQVHSFGGLIAASNPQNLTLNGAGGIEGRHSAANGSLVGYSDQDPVCADADHQCNRANDPLHRSKPGGVHVHAGRDASPDGVFPRVEPIGGVRFECRVAWASAGFDGYLRHGELHGCAAHTRSRDPHGFRGKEEGRSDPDAAREHAACGRRTDCGRVSRNRSIVFAARSALRTEHDRRHLRSRRFGVVPGYRAARFLHAVEASDAGRPHGGAPIRIAAPVPFEPARVDY